MPISVSNLEISRSGKILLRIPELTLDHVPTLLLGVNGAGKSTLLKTLCSKTGESKGKVYSQEKIAFVEQEFRPIVGFTSAEYCAYVAWLHGQSRKVSQDEANKWLGFVGLDSATTQRRETLSGGQKARLAIATALNSGADFLLLDEPSASLDPLSKEKTREIYHRIVENGQGLLVSTHDSGELHAPFERVIVLHEGEIVFDGTRNSFIELAQQSGDSPAHILARSFVQRGGIG